MSEEIKIQEILKAQPFGNIMKIKEVVSLKGKGAISGESFMVRSQSGGKYKLRYCDDLKQAKKIERNINLFPRAFPKFYGREGRYLLLDWINGEHITKELSAKESYQIGKFMGEAHALEDIDENKKTDDLFNYIIKILEDSGEFDGNLLSKIKNKYQKLKRKLKLDIVLEFNDVHPSNLIKDKEGKVYFLDEEGFTHKIKGLGLAKPFLINQWMNKREQRKSFWKGYTEHHSNNYFDRDYRKFISFLQLIRSISTKTRTKGDYSKQKRQLLNMISKNPFKRLFWR